MPRVFDRSSGAAEAPLVSAQAGVDRLETYPPPFPSGWYALARTTDLGSGSRALVAYVVGSWIAQRRQDVAIWESKVYRPRPTLVREAGPVHALRRWYAQFHPTHERTPPLVSGEERAGSR